MNLKALILENNNYFNHEAHEGLEDAFVFSLQGALFLQVYIQEFSGCCTSSVSLFYFFTLFMSFMVKKFYDLKLRAKAKLESL